MAVKTCSGLRLFTTGLLQAEAHRSELPLLLLLLTWRLAR